MFPSSSSSEFGGVSHYPFGLAYDHPIDGHFPVSVPHLHGHWSRDPLRTDFAKIDPQEALRFVETEQTTLLTATNTVTLAQQDKECQPGQFKIGFIAVIYMHVGQCFSNFRYLRPNFQ
ncbi:hypothetical protein TNCV_3971821 [Trichonephila clavipes]|nr:hypothetical protein TNCV_3971821 [Trichonephila clavipes]